MPGWRGSRKRRNPAGFQWGLDYQRVSDLEVGGLNRADGSRTGAVSARVSIGDAALARAGLLAAGCGSVEVGTAVGRVSGRWGGRMGVLSSRIRIDLLPCVHTPNWPCAAEALFLWRKNETS